MIAKHGMRLADNRNNLEYFPSKWTQFVYNFHNSIDSVKFCEMHRKRYKNVCDIKNKGYSKNLFGIC